MRIRMTSVKEEQLAQCIKLGLWGSNRHRLTKWENGDKIIFCVDGKIAAAAEIAGEEIVSTEEIWNNGLYPYRRPILFTHMFKEGKRPPVKGSLIEDELMRTYGVPYQWIYVNKVVMKDNVASVIWQAVENAENSAVASAKKNVVRR